VSNFIASGLEIEQAAAPRERNFFLRNATRDKFKRRKLVGIANEVFLYSDSTNQFEVLCNPGPVDTCALQGSTLTREHMPPFTVDQLIGYQVAEFSECSRRRAHVLIAQILIAVVAVASAWVESSRMLYTLAVFGLFLFVGWLWLVERYRRSRSVAERARRATLIMGGLGESISGSELVDIHKCFTVTDEVARQHFDPDYFASKSPPGFNRLAEMLEESSFWTKELQALSRNYMAALAIVLLLLGAIVVLGSIALVDAHHSMQVVRVAFAVLTSFVFNDVLTTAVQHHQTAAVLERIHLRLELAKSKNNPAADLLMLLSDYNVVVEMAPLNLPYIYSRHKARLNKLWQQRQSLN